MEEDLWNDNGQGKVLIDIDSKNNNLLVTHKPKKISEVNVTWRFDILTTSTITRCVTVTLAIFLRAIFTLIPHRSRYRFWFSRLWYRVSMIIVVIEVRRRRCYSLEEIIMVLSEVYSGEVLHADTAVISTWYRSFMWDSGSQLGKVRGPPNFRKVSYLYGRYNALNTK